MLRFKMFAEVKFNREIDLSKDYISLGGFEMVMGEHCIHFDFENYSADIDRVDPCKLNAEFASPDDKCFEDLHTVTEEMLKNITDIPEFFIYLERKDDDNYLKPVSLEKLYFEVDRDDKFINIDVPKNVCDSATLATDATF
ncbi:hypothetical protein [Bacteroides acidifaciens]|uniref:hypothetical protein n=1 Tax=Bacteroides acidifaciens TaxID=85831 RepID=UPI0026EB5015|nr:hypothetical protein [Bacteroides acidifaciens]